MLKFKSLRFNLLKMRYWQLMITTLFAAITAHAAAILSDPPTTTVNFLQAQIPVSNTQPPRQLPLIGGMSAPIFFTQFDEQKLALILNNTHACKINILYPRGMTILAKLIYNKLKINFAANTIVLTQLNLQDSKTTQYYHDRVIVISNYCHNY